jgi:UDP-glucose 4-epimerase
LRLANVYGPRDADRVIPLWVERASTGQDLLLYGGKQLIDFVWVDQVVEALVRAPTIGGNCPAINVGSGTGTPISQLAKRIALLSGGQSRVKMLSARSVEVTRFVADVGRMRTLLGIEPPIDPLQRLEELLWSTALPRVATVA